MDPLTGSALIGLAGSLFSSIFGAKSSANLNYRNRQWQEQMYQRQFDDGLRLWNMQNEYNSPVQQMQRLSEAGLNPNLIYSSNANMPSASLSTPSPGTPQTSAPQLDLSGISEFASFMLQKRQQDSQISLNDSQIEVQKQSIQESLARTNLAIANSKNIDLQSKRQIIENNIASATQQDRIDQMALATDLARVNLKLQDMSYQQRKFEVERLLPIQETGMLIQNELAKYNIQATKSQIANYVQQTQNLITQGKLLQIDFEWQRFLKDELKLDPHSNPWLVNFATGGLTNVANDIILPFFTGNVKDSRSLGHSLTSGAFQWFLDKASPIYHGARQLFK